MGGRIVGLTGPFGAGCTSIAKYLQDEHGFHSIKPREFIEEYARENIDEFKIPEAKNPEKRRALQVAGNIMRMDPDKDLLAKRIKKRIEEINAELGEEQDFVIDSLKNEREADFFRGEEMSDFDFVLVSVYSSVEFRKERDEVMRQYNGNIYRMKRDDRRDRDEFGTDAKWGQQVMKCDAISDISIDNDQNAEAPQAWEYQLKDAVDKYVLSDCPIISDVILYMWQAEIAASRSKCEKRHVGACIVKDGELLSIGWNKAPDNVAECAEHPDYRTCYRDHLRSKKEKEPDDKGIEVESLDLDDYDKALINRITDEAERQRYIKRLNLDIIDGYYYDFKTLEACRALHAEEMAILSALSEGKDLEGATIYTTTFPCMACAKKIAQVGISDIYFIEPYPIEGAQKLLGERNVKYYRYQGIRLRYAKRLWEAKRNETIDTLNSVDIGALEEEEVYKSVFQMLQVQREVNAILGRVG